MSLPLTTSLQCPRCGYVGTTTQVIPAGAKVRCPKCKTIIHGLPLAAGPVEGFPAGADLPADRLNELFESDKPVSKNTQSAHDDFRVLSESNERLPPRAGGPVPAGPKIVLDHKPLPFHNSRTFLTAILIAVAAMATFAFLRWYGDTVVSLDVAANKAGALRAKRVEQAAASAGANTSRIQRNLADKQPPDLLATPPTAPDGRTQAPATAKIGTLVVGVSDASLAASGGPAGEQVLAITLRITNLSSKPVTYVSWSDPTINVLLTDQHHNYYNRTGAATQSTQEIPPNRTITDSLQFEKPLSGAVLALDLPIGSRKFEFSLPAAFVQRSLAAIASVPKTAPPAPAQKAAPSPAAAPQEPYRADRDPQLIADVRAAYEEGMRRVEKRSLGMNSNNGVRFRKTEKEKIIKTIAEKLDMTVEQIQSMLP
jgi:hypothetical protein